MSFLKTASSVFDSVKTYIASKDKEIENGQLKIERYPFNDKRETWAVSGHQKDEEKEIRDRATMSDYHQKSGQQIGNIGRLKIKCKSSSNQYSFASGCIIHHSINKSFVMTTAHSIVSDNDEKGLTFAHSIWFEINENTINGYKTIQIYNANKYYIHPKYIECLKHKKEMNKYFDIAIIEIINTQNISKRIKPFKIRSFKSKMDCSKIKIIGFPGEKSLCGQLYGMEGIPIFSTKKTKIRYKNIKTSDGQDGSPIFKVSKDSDNIYSSFDEIIGVHTSAYSEGGYNYGTLLNDEILEWIHTVIDGDCVEFDDYQCCALLITSSKTKYAKHLNKIHKKFKKTEAINTIKLYYDMETADIALIPSPYFQQQHIAQHQEEKKQYVQSNDNLNAFYHEGIAAKLVDDTYSCSVILRKFISSNPKAIGIDCEWFKNRKVSLLQIANNNLIILIRLHRLKSIPIELIQLLKNDKIIKCGVGINGDVEKLKYQYSINTVGCIDLADLYQAINKDNNVNNNIGLNKLYKLLFNKHMKYKELSVTRSNWESKKLNHKQLHYAADDALAGYQIFKKLSQIFKREGISNQVQIMKAYSMSASMSTIYSKVDCYVLMESWMECLINNFESKYQIINVPNNKYNDYRIDDIDPNNIEKSYILYVIKNMFKNKRKSFIIYFCGESDENGNWIINQNKDGVITLITVNDIDICANFRVNDSKLFVISGCSRSGIWIEKHDSYDVKNINNIQASSLINESCNAGVFTSKYAECCLLWNQEGAIDNAIKKGIGGVGLALLGGLTVGTLYDGAIKQPVHKITKKSQPITTEPDADTSIGCSHDKKYRVKLVCYSAWYNMDLGMTLVNSMAIGSVGLCGYY